MPVIGRLDGQVDEVLIKPVSKKRGEADATHEQKPRRAPPVVAEETKDDTRKSERQELPVWLL